MKIDYFDLCLVIFASILIIFLSIQIFGSHEGSSYMCLKFNGYQFLPASDTNVCSIKDFGNGVIFFGCTDTLFATTLSDYVSKNKMVVTAIANAPEDTTTNDNYGYFVTVVPTL